MGRSEFEWILLIITLLAALAWASDLNKKLQDEHPESKPFFWGYYLSAGTVIGGVLYLCFSIVMIFAARRSQQEAYAFFAIFSVFQFFIGLQSIKRKRWALATLTIFSLNPLVWLINAIYLKNRWGEFSSTKEDIGRAVKVGEEKLDGITENMDKEQRISIFLSGFWLLSVVAFIAVFEPYGYRVDYWHAFKVAIFPPVIVTAGWFGYKKFV